MGFFLLLWARRYFQIDADSLLAVDRRPPILFLRSFDDDEKQKFTRADRTFLEFLDAMGESRYRNLLESIDEPIPLADAFHSHLMA